MAQKKSATVDEQIENLRGIESLADTPFSKLFHEARTSKSRVYSGVTLQVRVRDGEVEGHDTPVKTRQGEHLRGTDAWDSKVSLPVKPFMDVQTARQEIVYQLKNLQRTYLVREQREEEREKLEAKADR